MVYIFLAVLAVLLVMNGFMVIVLRQMTGATGRQIEKDAGRLFGAYDEMLEEKSRRLQELESKERELLARIQEKQRALAPVKAAAGPAFQGSPSVPAAFQDRHFVKMYGKVKAAFDVSGEELAETFLKNREPESFAEEKRRKLLKDMRELLDFDSLYRISILSGRQQKEVLQSVFSGEDGEIYREWEQEDGKNGVLGFSDWLDRQVKLSDRGLTVKASETKTAERGNRGRNGGEDVCWEKDPSICEGVKIVYQDRLYDYSV